MNFHAIKLPYSVAALPMSPLWHCKNNSSILLLSTTNDSRFMSSTIACQNRDPNDPFDAKTKKGEKGISVLQKLSSGVEKLGKGVQNNLSPKQKGDWKDITLMSLSFAVYVYMSQKIVCAYCAWMSMAGQPW